MNKISVDIKSKLELTPDDINNLVVAALEGGINYWCRKAEMKLAHPNNPDNKYWGVAPEFEDKIKYASDLIGYNGVLILYDAESPDKWELTLENFMKGVKFVCERDGYTSGDDLMDNHDADTADAIVQYALFNEIVFG